jgi:hypothetical protein
MILKSIIDLVEDDFAISTLVLALGASNWLAKTEE